MTPLRQRMLEDMQIRNLSPHTQRAYVENVARFARHFHRSPAALGPEEIRTYQVHLTCERKLAPSSIEIAVCALRFLYKVTLKHPWSCHDVIPAPKQPRPLPVVLSPDEVAHFLTGVTRPAPRTILTTCYAAGLRISEAVHLRPTDIDSGRMVIRVEQGKGQHDRYVMLSPKLLTLLRDWWRLRRPTPWLFPGDDPAHPITSHAVREACQRAHRRSRIPKPIPPHSMRHAVAVHLLDAGTDIRPIQLRLGHRRLETTARYLRLATITVCATTSPLEWLPHPGPPPGPPPDHV